MSSKIKAYLARRQAWATRRRRYGASGHSVGAYTAIRHGGPCPNCERMTRLVVRLYAEGTLSEGQAAKAIGCDRVWLRRAALDAGKGTG